MESILSIGFRPLDLTDVKCWFGYTGLFGFLLRGLQRHTLNLVALLMEDDRSFVGFQGPNTTPGIRSNFDIVSHRLCVLSGLVPHNSTLNSLVPQLGSFEPRPSALRSRLLKDYLLRYRYL